MGGGGLDPCVCVQVCVCVCVCVCVGACVRVRGGTILQRYRTPQLPDVCGTGTCSARDWKVLRYKTQDTPAPHGPLARADAHLIKADMHQMLGPDCTGLGGVVQEFVEVSEFRGTAVRKGF